MAKWRCTVCNYIYDEEKEGAHARSCGGEGCRCETPDELDKAFEEGFKSDRPCLFDVVIDPEIISPLVMSAEDD